MEDKVVKGLLKAEKIVLKIKKKVKRNDLDYTIQAVIDSTNPGVVKYAARITPLNEATGPLVFVADSIKELQEKLQYRLENGIDEKDITLKYHEAMVKNLTNTLSYHEQMVEDILKQPDEPKEAEIVSEPNNTTKENA